MSKQDGVPYGEYYLLGRLAMGGMAEVFLARGLVPGDHDDELLALKRTLPQLASNSEFGPMFIDEARIARQLDHPNICQVYDQGQIGSQLYIVMEFLHGKDLKVVSHRARQRDEPIPYRFIAFILSKIGKALAYAHAKKNDKGVPLGIVHRDISPQNLLVGYDGEPKLIDFGIAKAKDRLAKTRVGVVKGKFAYMSPEQAIGTEIDHRCDVFALGVVLYELITGEIPFSGESDFSTLKKIAKAEYTPPETHQPDIPATLVHIIERAMQREADNRFQTAQEMADALDRYIESDRAVDPAHLSSYMRKLFRKDYLREMARMKAFMEVQPPDAAIKAAQLIKAQRLAGESQAAQSLTDELRFEQETKMLASPDLAAGYDSLEEEVTVDRPQDALELKDIETSEVGSAPIETFEEATELLTDSEIEDFEIDVPIDTESVDLIPDGVTKEESPTLETGSPRETLEEDVFVVDTRETNRPEEEELRQDTTDIPVEDFEESTKLQRKMGGAEESLFEATTVPPLGDSLGPDDSTVAYDLSDLAAGDVATEPPREMALDSDIRRDSDFDTDKTTHSPMDFSDMDQGFESEATVQRSAPPQQASAPTPPPSQQSLRRGRPKAKKKRRSFSSGEVAVLMFAAMFGVLVVAAAYWHAAVGIPKGVLPAPIEKILNEAIPPPPSSQNRPQARSKAKAGKRKASSEN